MIYIKIDFLPEFFIRVHNICLGKFENVPSIFHRKPRSGRNILAQGEAL